MRRNIKKDNRGAAALLSVVIIGAVALLMAKNSAVIGRADLDMTNNNILSGIALSNAESCSEEALRQIQLDANFRSTGLSLVLERGTCLLRVSEIGGIYTINSEGRMSSYIKIIEVQAFLDNGGVTIDTWELK